MSNNKNPVVDRERQAKADRMDVMTLKSGVVLNIRKVATSIMMDVYNEVNEVRPSVPVTFIERLQRTEENPDDKGYQEALQAYKTKQVGMISDAFLWRGVTVQSTPKGFPKPSDEDWLDELRSMKLLKVDTKRRREFLWLKYVVLEDDEEYSEVIKAIGRKSGVREEDVKNASESFRSDNRGESGE
jgi:hypothetical protein